MERLAQLRSRLRSIQELSEVITAMRSMAASHAQEAAQALAAIRRYTEVVSGALGSTLTLLSARDSADTEDGPSDSVLIVFSSEHGFVGTFNESLVDEAERALTRSPGALWMIGRRGGVSAAERDLTLSWTHAMATHPGGVLEVARAATAAVTRTLERSPSTSVDITFGRASGSDYRVETRRLLPLDLSLFTARTFREAPLHYLRPELLLTKLIQETVLAELTQAAMETLASENVARLRAMESARSGIERKLDELRDQERRLRQEEITAELLDVVTGAEAILRSPI